MFSLNYTKRKPNTRTQYLLWCHATHSAWALSLCKALDLSLCNTASETWKLQEKVACRNRKDFHESKRVSWKNWLQLSCFTCQCEIAFRHFHAPVLSPLMSMYSYVSGRLFYSYLNAAHFLHPNLFRFCLFGQLDYEPVTGSSYQTNQIASHRTRRLFRHIG